MVIKTLRKTLKVLDDSYGVVAFELPKSVKLTHLICETDGIPGGSGEYIKVALRSKALGSIGTPMSVNTIMWDSRLFKIFSEGVDLSWFRKTWPLLDRLVEQTKDDLNIVYVEVQNYIGDFQSLAFVLRYKVL